LGTTHKKKVHFAKAKKTAVASIFEMLLKQKKPWLEVWTKMRFFWFRWQKHVGLESGSMVWVSKSYAVKTTVGTFDINVFLYWYASCTAMLHLQKKNSFFIHNPTKKHPQR